MNRQPAVCKPLRGYSVKAAAIRCYAESVLDGVFAVYASSLIVFFGALLGSFNSFRSEVPVFYPIVMSYRIFVIIMSV